MSTPQNPGAGQQRVKEKAVVKPNEASDKPQDQASRAHQPFERAYEQYLKTLQTLQTEWCEETNKQLAEHKRVQLEAALGRNMQSWNQMTFLPSPDARAAQQIVVNAWQAIKGAARSTEAYNGFLAQLKRALSDVKQDE